MFSIGEFSRIARVSKRLLQFYDEEHLLRPAFVDGGNGYRHYGAHQLAEINRILALKGLGLPLSEIKELLKKGSSTEELRARLQDKRQELQRDVAASLQRLRSLEARLLSENEAPDVVIKSFSAAPYLYRTTVIQESADAWHWVRETASLLRASLPRRVLDTFMVTLPGDGFETRNMTLEAGAVLVETISDLPHGFELTQLAERSKVATVAQAGGPDVLHTGCGSIGRYIERNGLRMVEPPREAFLEWPDFEQCGEAMIESRFVVESYPAADTWNAPEKLASRKR